MKHGTCAVACGIDGDGYVCVVRRRHQVIDASHDIGVVEACDSHQIVHCQVGVVAQSLGQLMPVGVVDTYHRRAVHLGNDGRGAYFGNYILKSCHIIFNVYTDVGLISQAYFP